jgi:Amt family ammonium transporter
MFAGIAVALFSGAIVERMRFGAFLIFGVLWSTLIYDPLAHWVWGEGGWLRELGALDFAGGTVVHISAGVTAIVLALTLGPRRDFGRVATVPHNVPFTLLGAGLLWFGWFGFNGGSALAADRCCCWTRGHHTRCGFRNTNGCARDWSVVRTTLVCGAAFACAFTRG